MIPTEYIMIPLSGAVIGYFTNWLAIKMLFRPHKEVRLFGIRLPFTPGIIPKEKSRLAKKIGETVSIHLITSDALATAVTSAESLLRIEQSLNTFFENDSETANNTITQLLGSDADILLLAAWNRTMDALNAFLPQVAPALEQGLKDNPQLMHELKKITDKIVEEHVGMLAGLFINKDKLTENIKTNILKYLSNESHQAEIAAKIDEWGRAFLLEKSHAPISELSAETSDSIRLFIFKSITFALEKGATRIAAAIPVGRIVEDQINAFGMDKGEQIVLSVLKRELNAITMLGGVLGFAIGLLTLLLNRF